MDENPSHTYATGGTYMVDTTVTTASGTKTETKEITIYQTPVTNVISDIEICSLLPNVESDLSTKDSEILGMQLAADFQVGYYASLADAQNDVNALLVLHTNSLAVETIYTRIHNIQNPDCYASTSFDIVIKATPELHPAADWTVCDSDTLAKAEANLNPLDTNYTNTSASQTIFYRRHNTACPECFKTGSFIIEITAGVVANTPTDITVCDQNGTGIQIFDLSTKDIEVLNGQDQNSFSVTYFANRSDAENNKDPLSKTTYSDKNLQESIYVRIQNASNPTCFDITQFDSIIYPQLQPNLEEVYAICPASEELTIDGGEFETWLWKDANGTELGTTRIINLSKLGTYNLTVTQTSNTIVCEETVFFEVVSL